MPGELQPQSLASVTPSRIAPSAADSSPAPSQSMRVRSTGSEGGISRWAASAAGSAIRLIQNSQRDVEVVDHHARQRQADAAADAEDGADDAQPGGHPLGRERVADDPEGEREDAARDALDHAAGDQHARSSGASAHTAPPSAKITSTPVSTRPLPNRSPSLPTIGVEIDAESRKPVRIHDVADALASSSRLIAGSAGIVSVCESAKATPASSRTARISTGCFASLGGGGGAGGQLAFHASAC